MSSQLDEEAIFDLACRILGVQERSDYLDQVCAGDQAFRERVEALLQVHEQEQELLKSNQEPDMRSTHIVPTVDQPSPTEAVGQQIGRYKLLQQIGEGGFGVVYMAEQHRPVRRKVALKVIKPGMDTKEVIARFEAERQALAMMDHPNIARVLDAGSTESDRPYFVMELVRGIPITDYCDRERLGTRHRLELFVQACQAVQHAHQKGVIHRDIKPSNVLITEHDGRPVAKVIDFGVAKAINQQLTERTIFTRFQQMIGTPMYMSPEQAELSGLDVDTRTDVYSLGVLLYELLTGTTPFEKRRFSEAAYDEIRRIIREEEPPKPSTRISTLGAASGEISSSRKTDVKRLRQLMRGELDWIVMKALEKERARRYETAIGFADDVSRYLNDEPVLACPPSPAYRLRKFANRNKALFATGAVVVTAIVLGLVGTASQVVVATRERDKAQRESANAQVARANTIREAERATQEAQRADAKSQALEEQLLLATVTRLCAQARSIHRELPVQSVLLALEAVDMARRPSGDVLPIARDTLLNTAATLGGRPLLGHMDRILDTQLDASGRWLVTGSFDGTARRWDLWAEDPSLECSVFPAGWVPSVAVSPDGRWLAAGTQLWDMFQSNPSEFPLKLHEATIDKAVVSPDGRWLATSSQELIRLRDLTAENPIESGLTLHWHGTGAQAMAFSQDGRWVAAGRWANSFPRLWDLSSEDPNHSYLDLPGHDGGITSTVISADSRWLATGAWAGEPESVKGLLWDLSSNRPAESSVVLLSSVNIFAMATSADARWLAAACGDGTVRVWDLTADRPSSASLILRGHESHVWGVAMSPDSRWLASASNDRTVRLWDLRAEEPAGSSVVLRGHEAKVQSIAFDPKGHHVITGGIDREPRVWELSEAGPIASPWSLRGHKRRIAALEIGPNSRWLITGSSDSTARLWDLRAETPAVTSVVLSGHESPVVAVRVTPDGRSLVTGSDDGTARVWNRMEDNSVSPPLILAGHEDRITDMTISPNGRWLVTVSADGTACLWDLTDANLTEPSCVLPTRDTPITAVAISPNGHWLVTAGGREARVWDLTAHDIPSSARLLSSRSNQWKIGGALAISPDSCWLATATNTVEVWDLNAEQPSPTIIGRHRNNIDSVAFSPDGQLLATGGFNTYVRIWDRQAPGEPIREFQEHKEMVLSLAFSSDGWLATGSDDLTVRLFDFRGAVPTSSSIVLPGTGPVAFSPDNRWLITRSIDRQAAQIWDLDVDLLARRARQLAGRELTPEERQRYSVDE